MTEKRNEKEWKGEGDDKEGRWADGRGGEMMVPRTESGRLVRMYGTGDVVAWMYLWSLEADTDSLSHRSPVQYFLNNNNDDDRSQLHMPDPGGRERPRLALPGPDKHRARRTGQSCTSYTTTSRR
jgi:hypothetical protein